MLGWDFLVSLANKRYESAQSSLTYFVTLFVEGAQRNI